MIPRYTLPEMGAIWSDAGPLRGDAPRRAGRGPRPVRSRARSRAEALAALESRARVDVERIAEIERTTDHDVIAFVSQVAETVGPEGRYLHLGLTSSDVVDTGLALQLRAAGERLLLDADRLLAVIVTPRPGRGGHGDDGPHPLGPRRADDVRASSSPAGRSSSSVAGVRLAAAVDEIGTGKISGPVGTYSHLEPAIEADVLAALGLRVDPISTQIVQRDRHAALLAAIAIVGGSLERFATEIRNLQHTEIGELQEPFRTGQKGSSAMPHKRNPILSERIAGLARLLRGYAQVGVRGPAAVARAGHQPLERRTGDPARTRRSCSTTCSCGCRARSRVCSSAPSGCARTSSAGSACMPRRACSSRSSTRAGWPARRRTRSSSARPFAPPTSARRCATCWPSTRRSPSGCRSTQLDACFDDAAFLRHVPEAIDPPRRARGRPRGPERGEQGGGRCWLSRSSARARSATCYRLDDGRLLLVASDRISAFDVVLPTTIPDKGRVLTGLSRFWFAETAGIVPNHLLDTAPEVLTETIATDLMAAGYEPPDFGPLDALRGRMMICRPADGRPDRGRGPWLPRRVGLEGIPRARDGRAGSRCRPDCARATGCRSRSSRPATKAELGEHDENIDFDGMVEHIGGWLPGGDVAAAGALAEAIRDRSLRLYGFGAAVAERRGILLADTKFEFGLAEEWGPRGPNERGGSYAFHDDQVVDRLEDLILIDEVLTPDSSRFWDAATYAPGGPQASFDKQFVRDWLEAQPWDKTAPGPALPDEVVAGTRARYVEAYERITGASFERYLREDVIGP